MYESIEIANLIEKKAMENKLTVSRVLKECGLDKSTISTLKNGSMVSADKLARLADYFDISADFLLGREPSHNSFVNSGDVIIEGVQGYNYGNITNGGERVFQEISEEQKELNNIYLRLPFKKRLELLNKAVELEEDK
ncbi:hypothetical protein FACS189490_13940 [Clostridia bacterium]|nr:hypothetical protein FACS189490_13940 [Clostridia bacterium]